MHASCHGMWTVELSSTWPGQKYTCLKENWKFLCFCSKYSTYVSHESFVSKINTVCLLCNNWCLYTVLLSTWLHPDRTNTDTHTSWNLILHCTFSGRCILIAFWLLSTLFTFIFFFFRKPDSSTEISFGKPMVFIYISLHIGLVFHNTWKFNFARARKTVWTQWINNNLIIIFVK